MTSLVVCCQEFLAAALKKVGVAKCILSYNNGEAAVEERALQSSLEKCVAASWKASAAYTGIWPASQSAAAASWGLLLRMGSTPFLSYSAAAASNYFQGFPPLPTAALHYSRQKKVCTTYTYTL